MVLVGSGPATPGADVAGSARRPVSGGPIDVRSPTVNGVAFSRPLCIDLRAREREPFASRWRVCLDGADVTATFHLGPLAGQWLGTISDLIVGPHQLVVTSRADGRTVYAAGFAYRTGRPIERIRALADATVSRLPPESLSWDWGPGLLLYALARLDAHDGTHRYEAYLRRYFAHHLRQGVPTIDWSDHCAPGLAALELYRQTGDASYRSVGEAVARYLLQTKPTTAGGLNHFGTSWFSWVYPTSMWVDSLMMYDVFAARWGKFAPDPNCSRFAGEQMLDFARVLQNPHTGLWKHAWMVPWQRPVPGDEVYWLRGNGWAMASLPEVLDVLPAASPVRGPLTMIYRRTAEGLLPYQGPTGLWSTVLNRSDRTYLETSGTALCAYGLLRGVQQGVLDPAMGSAGERAFLGVLDRLQARPDGPSMPETSGNTMPYGLFGYSVIPQQHDTPYGLAALILAGIAADVPTGPSSSVPTTR